MNLPVDESVRLQEAERTRRRRERWAIGVVAFLVAALTFIEAYLVASGGPVRFSGNIAIFALINLNVILVVLLIFLVSRNLFKILLDRRRGILGSKLRSRLVVIFILFSLLPTALLFVAATNITTTSIKSWIGKRVGEALSGSLEIARRKLNDDAAALVPLAGEAATLVGPETTAETAGEALRHMRTGQEDAVTLLFLRKGKLAAKEGKALGAAGNEILDRLGSLGKAGAEGGTIIGDGYAVAWVPAGGDGLVAAAKLLPEAEAQRIRAIKDAYAGYHQVRLLDDPIRASYIGVLILITLLIVFAASWMGIYLARRITVPVQLLAEGTDRVARGDLDATIDYRSDDEFGTLVGSFNRMTADLKAMQGNLAEAHASLTTTYEELRRRTQFIETILDNISTGVIVIDRHARIAMINKVAGRLLEVSPEEAAGSLYRDVFREDHYEAIRGLYREAGNAGGRQVERQVELPIGEKRIALRVSMTTLLDERGDYMGLVVAFDDLSQAMRLQRVLAWREVARRIAHDIRNPLTPIQLSTERMIRKYSEEHAGDPVFAECTQAVLSEVATLKRLVDEFTRFARMPAPQLEEGDLPEEVRQVVEMYRTSHPGIRWEFRAGEMPQAWFDPIQIRRALTNLLENAAAALGKQGCVEVSCAFDAESGRARITVADDGPGITRKDRERIFEPYFSRREGGTGLGLAIVSAIAADHGGTVRIRDNEPKGTVFEIEFPARPRGRE
ncbi:MAG: ATP-binding protein [Thermodesulfobacteriota bacterium]